MTRLLLSLLVLLSFSAVHAHLHLRSLVKSCTVEELAGACPDDSVEFDKLIAECPGTHGVHAAVCYMQYLCRNHDQETVNEHKDCINGECPLAKHAPTLNCVNYLATVADESSTMTDATVESTVGTSPPLLLEGQTILHPPNQTLPEEPPAQGEEPIDVEPEELINVTGVQVAAPSNTQTAAPSQAKSGGMSGTTAFLVVAVVAALGLVFLFRGRLFGPKENYPFDGHIGHEPPTARIS